MIDPIALSEEIWEHAVENQPCCLLGTEALAELQLLAKARGVSVTMALHQLLDAGKLHLEQEDARYPACFP